LALAAMWAFALITRIVVGKTTELPFGALAVGAAGLTLLAISIAVRPPHATVMIGGMLLGGATARVIGIATTPMDKNYSDNLPAIVIGLDRLVHGLTPYAIVDFGTHVNPMGYLPWTVLSYLPPFVAGFDIRVTNLVLSLGFAVTILLLLKQLALPAPARSVFGLLAALLYASPNLIGFDLFTEWQFFRPRFDLRVRIVDGGATTGRRRELRIRPGGDANGALLRARPVRLRHPK